jgi:UDP-N-acetylglucosamine:LPS N-acetylglucosamine transferase
VPTVFLPYPHHRDAHQRANTRPLVEAGAALVEEDLVSPSANALVPGSIIVSLMGDQGRLATMRAAFRTLGPANGAERVARLLLEPP